MTEPNRDAVNWPMLVASFLVAVMLWLVVFGQSSATNFVSMAVRPQGLDESRLFVTDVDRRIGISFRGDPRGVLNVSDPDSLVAYVDLSKAKPGRGRYPLRVTPASLAALATDLPETIQVELEEIVTQRFPIQAETTKSLASDVYTVERIVLDPAEAVVRGPKSEVAKITGIKATVPLERVNVDRPETIEVTLIAEGTTLEYARIEPLQTRATVLLNAAPAERDLLVRPRVTGRPAAGFTAVSYDLSPNTVTAQGDSLVLASLSQITAEEIDIGGISSTRTFEVRLSVPAGIRVKPATVK
ncbi:hypothetical protein EON79_08370, partial [bacterium]